MDRIKTSMSETQNIKAYRVIEIPKSVRHRQTTTKEPYFKALSGKTL